MKKWLRKAVWALSVAYLLALLGSALLLRLLGERWWVTGVALYLPRVLFAAALPLLLLLAVILRHKRAIIAQIAAGLVVLFPLMGMTLSWPRAADSKRARVRVLSFNVNSGYSGFERVASAILEQSPDLVLVQELFNDSEPLAGLLRAHYPVVQTSTQFLLASKYPIVTTTDPERLSYEGRLRSPRFLRHVIASPLGHLAVYNVHPLSPRSAFYAVRGGGLRHEILSGHIFRGAAEQATEGNTGLRVLQVEAVARMAAQEEMPVLIAGDTNLPGLSPVLSRTLGRYRDGFSSAGLGFGYTYPSRRPWLRIDRIFASDELRFTRFAVDCRGASDHLCVVADLERRP